MNSHQGNLSIEEYEKMVSALKVMELPKQVLAFYNAKLTEVDLYFFVLILHQEAENKHGLFKDFLLDNDKLLKYKKRLYEKALIRLEAIGLIEQLKLNVRVYYRLTTNGSALQELRLEAEDALFSYLVDEIGRTFAIANKTVIE